MNDLHSLTEEGFSSAAEPAVKVPFSAQLADVDHAFHGMSSDVLSITESLSLEDGYHADGGEFSLPFQTSTANSGGWCVESEVIRGQWRSNHALAYLAAMFDGPLFHAGGVGAGSYWNLDGKGGFFTWHAASAQVQLGKLAVASYGAIASCSGVTKFSVRWRPGGSGAWQWLTRDHSVHTGKTAFWRMPPRRNDLKIFNVTLRRRYRRFDIHYSAQSEPGAKHRFYVGFGSFPN